MSTASHNPFTHPFRLTALTALVAATSAATLGLSGCSTGHTATSVTTPGTAPTTGAAAPALAPANALKPASAIAGVVAAGTRIELVGEGFRGTEGPLGLPDGSLLFTENQGDRVTRIGADGKVSPFAQGLNGSNALALRADGALLAVQTLKPQVGVVHPAARQQVLATGYEGLPFGRPNDLVLDRQGRVWFTDSGANPPAAGAAAPAVYRVGSSGGLQRVAAGIARPNGIQLSPDEKVLYVANTLGEHVLAFDLGSAGEVGPARPFARLAGYQPPAAGSANGSSGADGLAVDAVGRLYVATRIGVQVFSTGGDALGLIELPRAPQNLAFAGHDRKMLYIVGRGAVWRLPVLTAGVSGRAK